MNQKCFMYCAGSYYDGYVIPSEADFVVAVDGGYEHLKKLGIKPQLAVGDFDSLGYVPNEKNVVLTNYLCNFIFFFQNLVDKKIVFIFASLLEIIHST